MRLEHTKDWKMTDKIFEDFENLIVEIDEKVFKTKKVVLKHR